VRRERPSRTLHTDEPAAQPADSPLRLRELPDADDGEAC
jgi:putative transposase